MPIWPRPLASSPSEAMGSPSSDADVTTFLKLIHLIANPQRDLPFHRQILRHVFAVLGDEVEVLFAVAFDLFLVLQLLVGGGRIDPRVAAEEEACLCRRSARWSTVTSSSLSAARYLAAPSCAAGAAALRSCSLKSRCATPDAPPSAASQRVERDRPSLPVRGDRATRSGRGPPATRRLLPRGTTCTAS